MESLTEKKISNRGVEIIVKDKEGQSIGSAIIRLEKRTAKIGYIGVKPNSRKKGIAKQLLKKCENWAEERGATSIIGTLIPTPGTEIIILKLLKKQGYTINKRGEAIKKLKKQNF